MADFIELITNHRSIRRFQSRPIDFEQLQALIAAGQAASTSSFIQAVSVIRVSEPAARSAFAELAGGQRYVESAPEFLVFCADLERNRCRASNSTDDELDYAWTEQFIAATVDVALFAQNVVIAAESQGLGCCYIGGIRNDPEQVTQLLKLPRLVYPVFGLCLGYPDQNPEQKPRLPTSTVLHQGTYQSVESLSRQIDDYDEHVRAYYIERTHGKLTTSWSEQMAKQAASQARPHMLAYLRGQGFALK